MNHSNSRVLIFILCYCTTFTLPNPLSLFDSFLAFIALLFSATFRKKIERLCRDVLTDPVRIVIGDLGEANTDITQVHTACADYQKKIKIFYQL